MRPRVLQYDEVTREQWDKFVYKYSLGTAHLLYDVVHIDRCEADQNCSFAIWDDDKSEICLIAQLHIEWCSDAHDKNQGCYRLHSRWGFVYKDNIPAKEFKKLAASYMNYIDELIKQNHVKSFEITFAPLSDYNQPPYMRISPGINFGFSPGVRYSSIVNLKKDSILKDCEYTTRASIKKIENGNRYAVIEAKANEKDFAIYHQILKDTYIRTGAVNAVLREEYNRNIFFKLIPQKIARVFFLKEIESEDIIATVCIQVFKNTAYYWWGGSINNKDVGVNKYLLYKSMEIVKADYADNYQTFWFETGGTYPYKRGGKYKGLSDYKKCFGTQLHPIYTGVYEMPV